MVEISTRLKGVIFFTKCTFNLAVFDYILITNFYALIIIYS